MSEGTEVSLLVDFEFGIPMIAGLFKILFLKKKSFVKNSENMLTAVKSANLKNSAVIWYNML